MSKYTEWFGGEQRPRREGYYQAKYRAHSHLRFWLYFDGTMWVDKQNNRLAYSSGRNFRWRGLTNSANSV